MNTIYHNPSCSKSRATLAILRERGDEPTIIEYLHTPPDRAELRRLIAGMGATARALIRKTEPIYTELGLADSKWTDDELIDFMVEHPILIERPIVVTAKGVRLGRPPEAVLEIL